MRFSDHEFILQLAKAKLKNPDNRHMRLGQLYFNELSIRFPEVAEQILATKYDMFYIDKNIDIFKEAVRIGKF